MGKVALAPIPVAINRTFLHSGSVRVSLFRVFEIKEIRRPAPLLLLVVAAGVFAFSSPLSKERTLFGKPLSLGIFL